MTARRTLFAVALAAGTVITSAAASAAGPPLPIAASGAKVQVLAGGVPTPTSLAFGRGRVFVGAGGSEDGKTPGGVFLVGGGRATRLPGSPRVVFGLTWHRSTLYVSAGRKLLAWSRWDGRRFASRRTVWTGPKRFTGLNGLAWGRDGRIYAGVSLDPAFDHAKAHTPYAQSVISLRPDGRDVRVVARGLRQPFQLTFVKGVAAPYVTVLNQDQPNGVNPLDFIVVARPGQNFGFPTCNGLRPRACRPFAKPNRTLPPHASPMGIGAIGQRLYVALFGGVGHGPEVASMGAHGGGVRPFLTGFAAPVVGLGVNAGRVYVGDLTGSIYSVKAPSR